MVERARASATGAWKVRQQAVADQNVTEAVAAGAKRLADDAFNRAAVAAAQATQQQKAERAAVDSRTAERREAARQQRAALRAVQRREMAAQWEKDKQERQRRRFEAAADTRERLSKRLRQRATKGAGVQKLSADSTHSPHAAPLPLPPPRSSAVQKAQDLLSEVYALEAPGADASHSHSS